MAGTDYSSYLRIDELLDLQHPLTEGAHDEMLFVVIHQAYELWFKVILHELDHAVVELLAGNPQEAMAPLQRATRVDELLIAQLRVLETLTPEGFLEFRDPLKPASGLQSGQFRAIEMLGGFDGTTPSDASPLSNKDREALRRRSGSPALFTALCASLRSQGLDAPEGAGTALRERRIDSLVALYRNHASSDRAVLHRVCELLLDHDEAISRWRFHHALMAARLIGSRPGTGGGGVAYLDTTIGLRFFPELWEVRNRL
ncbi:MAG TPA: tryptophan 2,3-dioxygenase family protein [Candidatus Saccharimonadales bacterium]|nr:tryptophan 2,3-dioxygenase family protein [Candidatus Saccharimonadales bacterium]